MLCKRLEVWWFLLCYYSTREYKSDDCKSYFLSIQYLYFPIYYLFYFDYWQYSILTLNGLLACCLLSFSLDFDLVRLDFLRYRISRNCFFFSNIFPYFWSRPWLEFPFYISRNLHWTPKAKHLKCLEVEQIGTAVQRDSSIEISNITSTLHIFFPTFFNSTFTYYW